MKQTKQPKIIWPERGANDWKPFREITDGERNSILEYFNDQSRVEYPEDGIVSEDFITNSDCLEYMLISNKIMVTRAIFTVYENHFKNGDDLVVMVEVYPTSDQLPGIITRFRMKNEIITEDDKFEYAWFGESR